MSIVKYSPSAGSSAGDGVGAKHRALHRLATVRRLQGVSRSTLARCLNVDVAEISRQEKETDDLPLSVLYQWQKVLDVPIAQLLVEPADTLSRSLMRRAQLVRLMKTAVTLLGKANSHATRRIAQLLVDQLIKIMPELQGVNAWNAVGERRRLDELGLAAVRAISDDVFLRRSA